MPAPLPALGALTSLTGGGGLNAAGAGQASSTAGDQQRTSGHVFNFAPPPQYMRAVGGVQQTQQLSGVLMLAIVVGALWLLMRKR